MPRLLALLLLIPAVLAQGMGPAKRVDSWRSSYNQKRLRLQWEVLPPFKPTKMPDGSEKPPRAPWPFLVYCYRNATKGSAKLEEKVFSDTRFVLATHAVKPVKIKPSKAIDVPYLAGVPGIKDPTIIVVDRNFEVVGAVKSHKDFTDKKVLGLMAQAAKKEYQNKIAKYVSAYFKVLLEEEKLWKQEMKMEKLRDKAAKSDPGKAKKLDKEADEIEASLTAARDDVAETEETVKASLQLIGEKKEALPTTFGKGKKKRKLTPQELEAIKTFREFSLNKNPIVRAAAVEDLGVIDSPVMVEAILKAAIDTDPRVTYAAGKALGQMKSSESLEAVAAGLNHSNAKSRTAAILGFSHITRPYPAAVPAIIKHLKTGDDEIRRAAIKALENQKDTSATPALIAALDDRLPALRVMAATALGTLKAADASAPLCEKLTASDWSLKKAAAEALGRIRTKDCIEPLLIRFEKEDGIMLEVLYKALVAVTGQDFKYRVENWRRWWDRYGTGFKVPTDAQIAEMKKKAAEALKGYYDPRKRKYHKIETLSRKMVFVIDVSSSMREKIVIPPYAPDELKAEFPSRVKWDIAEGELTALLSTLDRHVYFNIIAFAGKAKLWQDGMAGGGMRTTAIKYVAKLKPLEPSRGGGRRGAKSGQSDDQKTNTYAAIMAAFGQQDENVPNWKARTKFDTIFLVTDGIPTTGKITDVPRLVDEVTEFNKSRGVIIHVICFDRDAARKLAPLAERNGGQCVLRGWDGEIKKG